MTQDTTVKVRSITSLREFDALAGAWEQVTKEGGHTSPFLSHDWFACCWRTAGTKSRREAWVFEDAAGPLAIIPLVTSRARRRGLPVRTLAFMSSPETGFVDFPVARRLDEVVARFVARLRERRDWDVFSVPKLGADASSTKALRAALTREPFAWRTTARHRSPYLTIAGKWDTFVRHQSDACLDALRSVQKRLDGLGKVTVEEHRQMEPDGPVFADVMELASQGWKGPRGLSMITMNGRQRFFRELTRRAGPRGWLRVWLGRLDGRAIATEYQLCAEGRVEALGVGVDRGLMDASPEIYLGRAIVRSLFDRSDVREYHPSPGTTEAQCPWATDARELISLEVFAPSVYGRVLHCMESRLIPMARRWRASSRRSAVR